MARHLGREPFDPEAPLRVSASITRGGGGLRATIEVARPGAPSGKRQLSSAARDCVELASAVALTIAIAIDPMRFAAPPPAREPAPVPLAAPAPPGPAAPAPPPAADDLETPLGRAPVPRPAPVEVVAEAGVVAALGAVAPASPGLRLGGGLRGAGWSLALEARADLPARAELTAGGEVDFWLVFGALVPCLRAGPLSACALACAGALRSAGADLEDAQSGVTPFLAAGGRVRWDVALGERLALALHGELLGHLARTTVTSGGEAIYRTPSLSGALGAGVALRF